MKLTLAGSLSDALVRMTEFWTGKYSDIVTLYVLNGNTGRFGFLVT